jgi:hypothetical protein
MIERIGIVNEFFGHILYLVIVAHVEFIEEELQHGFRLFI